MPGWLIVVVSLVSGVAQAQTWQDATASCLGRTAQWTNKVEVADVDGDGDLDLWTGGAYQTQLRLFVREGSSWLDATAQLPQVSTSVGDAEFGDVDNDGDLDLVLAEWAAGNPSTNAGGRTTLYLKACAVNVLPGRRCRRDGGIPPAGDGTGGGCCDTRGDPRGGLVLALVTAAAGIRRRRPRSP